MERRAGAGVDALAPWGAAVAVLAILALTRGAAMPVGVFYDDGIYLDLARSLASGAGYHHRALPGAPSGVHYPPLYPLWLFGWSVLRPPFVALSITAWLKVGNALLAAGSVVPWARWGARRFGLGWLAAIAAAVSVLFVPARAVTGTLFSEPLAWLLVGLALDLADVGDEQAMSRGRTIAAGVVGAVLPLARTILLPVTVAVAWRLATDPTRPVAVRRRDAAIAAFMILPTLGWFAWTRQHGREMPAAWVGSYGSYAAMWRESISGLGDLGAVVAHQAGGAWRVARQLWAAPLFGRAGNSFFHSPWWSIPLRSVGLALCAAGLWRVRGWRSVSGVAVAGYLAMVLVWPVEPDRFVWGVLPLVTMLFFAGAAAAWRAGAAAAPWWRAAVLAGIALPAASCTLVNARGYRDDGWIAPQRREATLMTPVVRWAATLPRDVILLAANDPFAAQATGLRTAPLLPPDLRETRGAAPGRPAAERVAASACAAGAGWMVVVDTLDETAAAITALRAAPPAAIRFGTTLRLDGPAAAVQFTCDR